MKMLLDFLPLVLFFGVFKYAGSNADWAAAFATEHLGFMVSGGVVDAGIAPILLSTVTMVFATLAQVAFLLARKQKVHVMLWVSLGLVTVLGIATVVFHSRTFIQWKPTVLYWLMAAALLISQTVYRKNLLQSFLGKQMNLPPPVWIKLNLVWVGFFTLLGFVNWYVFSNFSEAAWVNFKVFGFTAAMFVFIVVQFMFLGKYIQEGVPPPSDAA